MEPLHVFSSPLRTVEGLPPFPTPEILRAPSLPAAPVAPSDARPDPYFIRLWTSAVKRLCGHWPGHPRQLTEASKLCMAQLHALDIPAATWVLHRYNAFLGSDVPDTLHHPPFGFVFSPNALARELEGPLYWLYSLAIPRTILLPESKNAIAEWQKLRTGRSSLQEYEMSLLAAQQANVAEAAATIRAVQQGEYVW